MALYYNIKSNICVEVVTGSDHVPIEVEIGITSDVLLSPQQKTESNQKRFNWRKTD